VPIARIRKEGCPEFLIAVLDPNKTCSLEGTISLRDGNSYATATFTPTAPGRVKIRMECNFDRDGIATLYLSCYKVMECRSSGVFEQEIDLRGISEPIVFIVSNKDQFKQIAKYVRTAIAGLCSGAPAELRLWRFGIGGSITESFIKPYVFSQRGWLPHCEIYTTYDMSYKEFTYPYSCIRLLGGYRETYHF